MTTDKGEPTAEPDQEQPQEKAPPDGDGSAARAMTIREPERRALPPGDLLVQVQAWGKLMAASGFFPDATHEAQAAVKVLFGLELGFTPGAAMTGVYLIEGKPTLSANLQAQALKRSGRYDYRIVEHDHQHCIIEFVQIAGGQRAVLGTSEFTIDDADRAGLLNRGGRMWEKYPRNMLFSRALTNGIGWFCPDAFDTGKLYTPDELRPDMELGQNGEIIDASAVTVEPAPVTGSTQRSQGSRRTPAAPATRGERPQRQAPAVLALGDVKDVQTLMTFAGQQRQNAGLPVDGRAVLRILGVEVMQEITAKYRDVEGGWQQAGRAILADIELATGKPVAASVQDRVEALSEQDRALYDAMIGNGETPEDALNIIEVDDVGEAANAADDEAAESEAPPA